MKKWLIFFLMLLVFTTPVSAQTTVDPAAYLPARTPVYVEVRVDAASQSAYNGLLNANAPMLPFPLPPQTGLIDLAFTALLNTSLPDISFQTDIQPWLADRIAFGAITPPSQPDVAAGADFVLVLPIGDQAGAQTFVQKASGGAAPDTSNGIPIYSLNDLVLALGTSVMWIGTPDTINRLLTSGGPENLTQNPAFAKVRTSLAADAPIMGYMSGPALLSSLGLRPTARISDFPTPDVLVQAALKLYPGQSALKDALLTLPPFAGVGFSAQIDGTRVDLTGVASLTATYAAPTLASATAGTDLLNLLPANSFFVYDSYELPLTAAGVFGFLFPIGSVSSTLVTSLDGSTPPTTTPTPTPEPITVESLVAQVQPYLAQAASLMGMSLSDAYSLLNGEYTVALFPGPGPLMGEALYLKTSDPQRLIDAVDHAAKLVLLDPQTGQQLVAVQRTTVSDTPVALLSIYGYSDRYALGTLGDNVLFLTNESSLRQVIDAAKKTDTIAPPLSNWRSAFSTPQAALLYSDVRTFDLYLLRAQRNPPLPVKLAAGSLNIGANGLFTLHVMLTTGE